MAAIINIILRDEWNINYKFNPYMERYCRKMGIRASNSYIPEQWMLACKEYCVNHGVWFKTKGERVMWFDMIAIIGGDKDWEIVWKGEVESLRRWCRTKGHGWGNYTYDEDTAVYLGRDTNPMARRIRREMYDMFTINGQMWIGDEVEPTIVMWS